MILVKYIKLAYHTIRLIINPEGNIKSLIYLGDIISESEASNTIAKKLFINQELANMHRHKKGLESIDLTTLSLYSKESLGYILYEFYTSKSLDVYPMGRFEEYTQSRYVSERTRKSHDLLHVILGYGTDLIGEAKVNAYVLNQSRMPINFLILIGIGLKYLFKSPLQFLTLINEIEEGWKMGYKTDLFLIQDWEIMMRMPLDEVRHQFIKKVMVVSGKDNSFKKQVA